MPSIKKNNHIFGENNRIRVSQKELKGPLRKIGILNFLDFSNFSLSKHCTASLVSNNLILTAAHCVVDDEKILNVKKFTFRLGYTAANTFLAKSRIEEIIVGSLADDSREGDWALLRLGKPLGKLFGFLEVIDPIENNIGKDNSRLIFAGHSATFNKPTYLTVMNKFCSIKGFDDDQLVILHDCDIAPGDSGGPLLNCDKDKEHCQIIGVLFSQRVPDEQEKKTYKFDKYISEYANTAISSKNFMTKLLELSED